MDEYDELFRNYFNKFELDNKLGKFDLAINAEFRGVPIRGGTGSSGLGGINSQNCIGDPNELKCPKGYFCNNSIRQWQCL